MEIVAAFFGAIVGSVLTCIFAVWLQSHEKWKIFQEEIELIKAKFLQLENTATIDAVSKIHRDSMNEVISAVCTARPYVRKRNSKTLLRLLDDYRTADQRQGTGFLPADLAGNYRGSPSDCFADPQKAVCFLIRTLNGMVNC